MEKKPWEIQKYYNDAQQSLMNYMMAVGTIQSPSEYADLGYAEIFSRLAEGRVEEFVNVEEVVRQLEETQRQLQLLLNQLS